MFSPRCIFFAFLIPELLSFGRALRMMLMRTLGKPTFLEFLVVFVFETLHVTGLALLFFVAFPAMDSVKVCMAMSAVAIMPGFFNMFNFKGEFKKSWMRFVVIGETLSFFVFPLSQRKEMRGEI